MGQPQRISSPDGYAVVTRSTLRLVPVIRTSSTPPASPCTGKSWVRADLLPEEPWNPTPPETRDFKWASFPDWHQDAACRDIPEDKIDSMFFGETDDPSRTSLTITKIKEVKAFCRQCPVYSRCLEHSLTTPERHGVWAGTSKRTRGRILNLLHLGEVTLPEVIDDYVAGRERKYETIRHP
jgi:WhiB family redox-sensing transcriptional regulator